jgi:hypothetical protein
VAGGVVCVTSGLIVVVDVSLWKVQPVVTPSSHLAVVRSSRKLFFISIVQIHNPELFFSDSCIL